MEPNWKFLGGILILVGIAGFIDLIVSFGPLKLGILFVSIALIALGIILMVKLKGTSPP